MHRRKSLLGVRMLIGVLLISMVALTVRGQQTTINDASKSAYDFDSLSGVIDADQVDYFSGNWSYVLPLGEVEGAGGMSLPIRMRYSSAVTGTDRLIKLSDNPAATSSSSQGTVTLNNATWVGLGWNLEFGAIRVTGGYEMEDSTSPINHPFSFNLSLVLPDGSHRLVRQLDDSERAANPGIRLPATNVYYAENRKFMDVRWNFDRHAPLASTWTVKSVSGLIYTFGALTIGEDTYGMNQTVKGGAVLPGRFEELMPEMVYQWNLAEIRDQAGNTIRFSYASDGPVTTVRDWARERADSTRTFRNLLDFADLDPRYPGGIDIGRTRRNLTVVKTFHTGHLAEAVLAGADGKVARKIATETSAREDVHVARHRGVVITYDNYFDTHLGDPLPYGHYLVRNNHSYRMYDGLSSAHRLDALKVTDAEGNQIARYAFRYEDDKRLQVRPPVAPGDNVRTLLLKGIAVMGTGGSAGDNLPPYRFTNNYADSYRVTKIVTPTGGELDIGYEKIADPPDLNGLKYDDALLERSRRIKQRTWDADGSGGEPAQTTSFVYVQTDQVKDILDSKRLRRITFPIVDEVLPGRHGKIRREFVGEADLNALGLSARDRKQEAERNIRRGLLESTTYHDASGAVVQRERTDWEVTAQGTWTGRWQPFYHPGIPQQAYWLRAGETTTTKDGVSTTTEVAHNARNGLVARQTLKSGSHTLRVTDTSYHGDEITSGPVTVSLQQPVLDRNNSEGDRLHAAFLERSPTQTAKVEAFVNANSRLESTGRYDFTSTSFDVSNYTALRLKGLLRTSAIDGPGLMVASWLVTVRWNAGGSSVAADLTHTVSVEDGPIHYAVRKPFDVVIPVPAGASSADVNVQLTASVRHPEQSRYRKIGITASKLQATGLSAEDAESVLLDGRHILDRPHVVTVRDGSGTRLQSNRHRYGLFNNGGIVMPDTTSAWLDRDSDGQVDAGEWIDRQVATGYDAYGNLTEARDAHGTVTSTIMGYGNMRPLAAFTGAAASQTAAVVFDDYAGWADLDANAPGSWSKTGGGTPVLAGGVLSVNNTVARRDLPANASGVFEIDVMVESENERTAVALAAAGRTGTDRIRWVFDADGTFKALSGNTLTATGDSYAANQWYHVKIQWSGSKWWAHVDGVRYPALGDYTLSSGDMSQVKLSNGASSASASFDNLRAWPSDAQPAAMTTFDPVTLDAVAVTDPNGHTTRLLRDGLRRVVQTIDGAGRITAQRDHRFSRGISSTSVYNQARPNRQADIAYLSRDGHKDLSADGHRVITRGTGDSVREGVSLATADPYVVASGEDVVLKASVRVRLTTGFRASAGADFRAGLDPLAGGNQVTGTGAISYNVNTEGKRSVRLAPDARLETGRISGHVTARADFYPASTSSGKTVIMAFEDGDDHVRMVFEDGGVKLESSIDGSATSASMGPRYSRSRPWARVEMELLPSGKVNAWVYDHETTRFKGASRSVTVPANWTPMFTAEGSRGNGYLSDLYIGTAEASTSYFDGLARNIQSRIKAGSNDIVTQTGYNRFNKPDTLLGPVYLSPSHTYGALTKDASEDRVTKTFYDDDPLLRLSRVIPPGHDEDTAVDTRYGYWSDEPGLGRSFQTVDDEKGIRTASVHDPYGRMVYTIADSAGTSEATGNNKTSFAYDALDRLASSTMPGGARTTYAYDTLGRMTSKRYPDADGPVRYKYDDLGRLRFSQDARQRALTPAKVTFTIYDAFGRVTSVGEAAADFSSLDPQRSYPFERDSVSWRSRMYYDADGIVSGLNSGTSGPNSRASGPNYAQGRLSKVEENTDGDAAAEVVHRYAYDHLGNVRVKKVAIDGLPGEKTVAYVHDLAGRVSRLIYPDGSQARYAYDGAGRLARVWDARGATLASYTHTAAGNMERHVAGDGIATGTFAYNLREWVTEINYPGRFTINQRYDAVGNVTSQHYKRAASESKKAAAYTYDRLHRLTAFNLSGGQRQYYRYDRSGNLVEMLTNSSYTLYRYENSSAPNRVSFVYGGGLFIRAAYNPNGWMTRMTRNALTYDYRGLLTGHGSASYTMDPDRRRVKKTAGTAVTYYLRGADGAVLAEYDSSQSLTARYVYAGSRRIARVAGSGTSYYLADHLGSTRSLIDEAGDVTAAYDYWPYGKMLASSGAESTHFRFTGHERDAESRLDYMLERSYAYDMGRFLRPDPMQDKYPGISPYVYANNNPLKYVDPDGNKLRYAPGVSTKFKNYFARAVKYLNELKASANLARLESSESVVYLAQSNSINYYNSSTKTIYWNPLLVLETKTGNKLPPVMGLDHEIDHGLQDVLNPGKFSKDLATQDANYGNMEERRVIQGSESELGRKMGMIKSDEQTRYDHSDKRLYLTNDPISTEEFELPPIKVTDEREKEPKP